MDPPFRRRGRGTRPPTAHLALAAVALLVVALAPLGAAQSVRPILQITIAPSTGDPLPGTTAALSLAIKNVGTTPAYTMVVNVISIDAPIQINNTERVSLGALGAGDSTTFTPYRIWVPPETPAGLYQVAFGLDYVYQDSGTKLGSVFVTGTITVRSPPALHVGPLVGNDLAPGQSEVYQLTLRNVAPTQLRSLQGTWVDPKGILLPLGLGNELFLTSMAAEATLAVPIEVAAPITAPAGIYPINVAFSYTDANGAALSAKGAFAVQVRTVSILSVGLDEWTDDELTLSISNVGIGPANAVEVRLGSGPITTRPAAVVFLGNLQPGDHTTATFAPATPSGDGGALEVSISFTDTNGVRQEETRPLEVGEAPQGANGGLNVIAIAGGAAVVLIAIFWLWRRRK